MHDALVSHDDINNNKTVCERLLVALLPRLIVETLLPMQALRSYQDQSVCDTISPVISPVNRREAALLPKQSPCRVDNKGETQNETTNAILSLVLNACPRRLTTQFLQRICHYLSLALLHSLLLY